MSAPTAAEAPDRPTPAARLYGFATGDWVFRILLTLAALAIPLLLAALTWELVSGSRLAIAKYGLRFLTTSTWDPVAGQFGALPLIFGTVVSSIIALLIAVPLSLGVAIFLTEFAPKVIRQPIAYVVELLAAVPSVVYGLWGIFFLLPFLRTTIFPVLRSTLGFLPFFQGPLYGPSMLSAGIILAIMVMPYVMSVTREVLNAVPGSQREAALALGATRWEAAWTAVVPYARSGIVGAVILGLGRALGETMAVTMVIGNSHDISASLFAPGYTMAAAIANEFTEAATDIHFAALAYAALVLFAITVLVNALARILIWRVTQGRPSGGGDL
ncbi:MAG TPA: phosphate ABC transporter permease subunit PstC [Gemmatimonadales bacterium]|nr:phosphate ABC transporter permease subunit PstC [Gemmatimonadales bacterium]